jgi:hypothetical protein
VIVGSAQIQGQHVRSLQCPNCGGTVNLRGFAHTLTVVCVQCLSVLDAKSPGFDVLQRFQNRERFMPLIPLGTRGKLHGDPYEAIGFQVREIEVEGIGYRWSEYLLFNPYKGFRYLTEYNGHWNDVTNLKADPEAIYSRGKKAIKVLGETYRHFQSAVAETIYVMGEFPWRVRVGERIQVDDYISPPRMASSERTQDEVVWSIGEYTSAARVWQGFGLQGKPPAAVGVFANQPSPYTGRIASIWIAFLILCGLLLCTMLFIGMTARRETVLKQSYIYRANTASEQSFVTPMFELKGRPSNVEVEIYTNLENDWAFFGMALINDDTGQAWDFGREVSYYHGRDSDGSWTEGSRVDTAVIPRIPSGRYYLRIEPEMDSSVTKLRSVAYSVQVRRDVPTYWLFGAALVLLLVPPVLITWRSLAFETTRWNESDYASSGSSDE